MLVVTDNGVQVLLKQKSTPKIVWRDMLLIIVLGGINVFLCFVLHLYPAGISMCFTATIIVFTIILSAYRKRNQPIILSGGDLLLSPHTFKHTSLGKTTQYQLTQSDKVETQNDCVKIRNAQHKILYQINGFSEPKQIEVAQAVLEGKSLKTQGKSIKMQTN